MEISVLEWKFMAHNAIRVQIFKTPYTYAKRISEIMVVHRCYRFTLATTPLRDVSTKSAVFFGSRITQPHNRRKTFFIVVNNGRNAMLIVMQRIERSVNEPQLC
jgi:hypothetical protein